MGFLSSDHIQSFVKGQTILSLTSELVKGQFRLNFEGGESLRLYIHKGELIATPFQANGEIKQSTKIQPKETP